MSVSAFRAYRRRHARVHAAPPASCYECRGRDRDDNIGWASVPAQRHAPLTPRAPGVDFLLGFLARFSIAGLNFSDELIPSPRGGLKIIIGEIAPLLLGFALKLLPIAFHLVPVYRWLLSGDVSKFGGRPQSAHRLNHEPMLALRFLAKLMPYREPRREIISRAAAQDCARVDESTVTGQRNPPGTASSAGADVRCASDLWCRGSNFGPQPPSSSNARAQSNRTS